MRIKQGEPHLRLAVMALSPEAGPRRKAAEIYDTIHMQEFRHRAEEAGRAGIPEQEFHNLFSRGFELYARRLRALGADPDEPDSDDFRRAERDARELSHVYVNAALAMRGWSDVLEREKFEYADIGEEVAAVWDRLTATADAPLEFTIANGALVAAGAPR